MIRVALVSDTHGFLDPRIAERVTGCDLAVHAGDVGSGEVLGALRRKVGVVVAVRGNNDTPAKWTGDRTELEGLPLVASLELPGGRLVVVHGDAAPPPTDRRHARLRAEHPEARAVVYGHSHRLVRDTERRPWILNPGAAGKARTHGGPSCLLLSASESRWRLTTVRY